jgi:hypothetical protein
VYLGIPLNLARPWIQTWHSVQTSVYLSFHVICRGSILADSLLGFGRYASFEVQLRHSHIVQSSHQRCRPRVDQPQGL